MVVDVIWNSAVYFMKKVTHFVYSSSNDSFS